MLIVLPRRSTPERRGIVPRLARVEAWAERAVAGRQARVHTLLISDPPRGSCFGSGCAST